MISKVYAVRCGAFDSLETSLSIADQEAVELTGVHTAMAGTKNPGRWLENAKLLESGLLPAAAYEAIRPRWTETAGPDGSAKDSRSAPLVYLWTRRAFFDGSCLSLGKVCRQQGYTGAITGKIERTEPCARPARPSAGACMTTRKRARKPLTIQLLYHNDMIKMKILKITLYKISGRFRMMKALIVIDYTVDFVVGKLPCGQPGIGIEQRIAELTREFAEQGAFTVMAVDLHDEHDTFHPEHKLFPPHNIRGTEGRRLYGQLEATYEAYRDRIYWMDKTRYSSFCGTDLELQLRARGIQEVHLAGVCTDICVLHTAVDAYNKGFHIVVHEDAVATFNPPGQDWALRHFQNSLGARIVRGGEPVRL